MALTLLHSLCAAGIALRADGDSLVWRAEEGRMTPALLGAIKANKPGLLELVRDLPAEVHPFLNDIELGDALDILKQIPDNSVDLIVTDPPYGYGFMGKDWDKVLPDTRIWVECLRVLKPGGFAFVMASPRQDVLSRMTMALEDAGFETGFTSLYWTYATGFPKAHNIGKAVDRKLGAKREVLYEKQMPDMRGNNYGQGMRGYKEVNFQYTLPETQEAKRLDGSYAGFQPKPAVEVILVVMKPLERKGYTNQVLHNGKGVTWLDDCRIPYGDEVSSVGDRHQHGRGDGYGFKPQWKIQGDVKWTPEKEWKQDIERQAHQKGRFPANLLVSDGALDDGKPHKSSPMDCIAKTKAMFAMGNSIRTRPTTPEKPVAIPDFSLWMHGPI